jgi:hypothetical protein
MHEEKCSGGVFVGGYKASFRNPMSRVYFDDTTTFLLRKSKKCCMMIREC